MAEPHRVSSGSTRFYNVDGVLYPSVTSILSIISKPALIAWAAKQGSLEKMRAVQKEALNVGSVTHQIIEIYLTKSWDAVQASLEGQPVAITTAFNNFLAWAKDTNFRILSSEFTCYSKKYEYAGTADGVAMVDGQLCVVDWKTSSGIWDEFWLQTEAYSKSIDEMAESGIIKLPGMIEKRAILRLAKKEDDDVLFEPRVLDRSENDFKAFIHAKHLWLWQQEMNDRRKHEIESRKKAS